MVAGQQRGYATINRELAIAMIAQKYRFCIEIRDISFYSYLEKMYP
jgi:hypothetical protein